MKKFFYLKYNDYLCNIMKKVINLNTKDYILFCGDTHDENNIILNFLKKHQISNSVIFHVGDYGIGWRTKHKELRVLNNINERLKSKNNHLIVSRGNHDDPEYFKNHTKLSNIQLIPDYSIINVNEINILNIGGAISVDRIYRKQYLKYKNIKWDKYGKEFRKNISTGWWVNENVSFNNIINEINNIDVVISHTAPSFVQPYRKNVISEISLIDLTLAYDLTKERELLSDIYNKLIVNNNIKNWYYGHFHFSNTEYYNQTKFQLLNINEIVEHKIK